MSQATDRNFTAEESAAIIGHMNGDHSGDSVLMCRALAGLPETQSARVVGVDREGIDFEANTGGATVIARIPWGRTLTARAEVRGEVVRLYQQACAALGIEPRQSGPAAH